MNEEMAVQTAEEEQIKELVTDSFIKELEKTLPKLPRKVGRNERCVCGSGKKFKYCCIYKYQR
jgi:uncharacterized protein YchJ